MEDRKGIFRSMTIGSLRRRGLGRNQTEVVDELCAEKPANTEFRRLCGLLSHSREPFVASALSRHLPP